MNSSDYAATRHKYWDDKEQDGKLACPGCGKLLKVMTAGAHTKNAGRQFVSCNKDYHGCGFFGFTDVAPGAPKGGQKRGRSDNEGGGTSFVGPVARAPNATDQRLEELATEVATLRAAVQNLEAGIRELVKGLRVVE